MSAKPAPKKSNRRGNPQNLRPTTKGKPHRKPLALFELQQFCIAYIKSRGSNIAACRSLSISNNSGIRFKNDPRFKEELDKLTDKFIVDALGEVREIFVLNLSEVDRFMFGILSSPRDPDHGFRDQVNSGHVIYKRMKAIEPARVMQGGSTAILTSVTNQVGSGQAPQLPHLFEPPWRKALREAQTVADTAAGAVIEGEIK